MVRLISFDSVSEQVKTTFQFLDANKIILIMCFLIKTETNLDFFFIGGSS